MKKQDKKVKTQNINGIELKLFNLYFDRKVILTARLSIVEKIMNQLKKEHPDHTIEIGLAYED